MPFNLTMIWKKLYRKHNLSGTRFVELLLPRSKTISNIFRKEQARRRNVRHQYLKPLKNQLYKYLNQATSEFNHIEITQTRLNIIIRRLKLSQR